jgi:nucleotide-binding universal stress UspA family protein
MTKKILVALDDSDNSMRAVEFVAQTLGKEHEITLLSVVPDTSAFCEMTGFNSPTLTPYYLKEQGMFCTLEDRKKEHLKEVMQEAEETLTEAGFDKGGIRRKMVVGKKGAAKEIIEEAKDGYDAVVLGRRGLSGLSEFLLGSVSNKVLNSLEEASVILVK